MTKDKKYYYYPPQNPQFFFPADQFKSFSQFYTPYSSKAIVFWNIFKTSSIVRNLFSIAESKIPLPIKTIKSIVNLNEATFFYNKGTEGVEQKATMIIHSKKGKRFLKFGITKIAKDLIKNEAKTLVEIESDSKILSAKVISHNYTEKHAYLLTDVIEGAKLNETALTETILNYLLELAKHQPEKESNTINVFSHGDFCPWNMIVDNKTQKLTLIDWEMTGYKTLGYDLFTFVFQTNFLLNPKKTPETIIRENKENIQNYFNFFNVDNWQDYLTKFAAQKVEIEKQKEDPQLYFKYKDLLNCNDKN